MCALAASMLVSNHLQQGALNIANISILLLFLSRVILDAHWLIYSKRMIIHRYNVNDRFS
jgi:hypothetical protein